MIRAALVGIVLALAATTALAATPTFPALSGRVVDAADILPAETEVALSAKLQQLETATGHQLVVATLPGLQGYEIEEYGYQLGRAWGIGSKDKDDGAVFIVAPAERKVRIEVGYGLEGVLTDAMSSFILQSAVLPRFKAGDMAGGVVAGADAIIEQLSLDRPAAEARAAQAGAAAKAAAKPRIDPTTVFILFLIVVFVLRSMMRGGRSRRGLWIPPVIIGGSSWGGRGGWGGGGGGGGGFGGGGGSFGGGGSSGSW